jgi:hypothetical protein
MAQPHEVWHGWMFHKQFRIRREYPHRPEFKKGDLVKVVMVSRFGDVGLTKDLAAEFGYDLRVEPWELDLVDPLPADICRLCLNALKAGGHEECREHRKCERCGGDTSPANPVCTKCHIEAWRKENAAKEKA